MPSRLNPYISFRGDAREAMEFYKSVFGGKLELTTFGEFGASDDPEQVDKIMHSQLEAGNGILFMASDTPPGVPFSEGSQVTLSLNGEQDTDAELSGYFEKLSNGGTITMPLEQAPWGAKFGMLVDRFGVNWMVNIADQSD